MEMDMTGAAPQYDRAQAQINLLLAGKLDYVEAGDCRVPGQELGLRAIATQNPDLPIAIYGASKSPKADAMEMMSAHEATNRLRARSASLEASLGPCARVFGITLRKMWSES